MKTGLRVAALAVLLVALATWLFGGAHRVSATSVLKREPDPVTGLENMHFEKQLVLGLDFLAAAGVVAAGLFGASWFFGSHPKPNQARTHST
jgi:hypothetical protein